MANLVVHFEIHATDPQGLVDFYSGLFGWTFTRFGDATYWSIDTGEGAIGNVAGTAAATDWPGIGRAGYLLDPDGNVFGMISPILSDGTRGMGGGEPG